MTPRLLYVEDDPHARRALGRDLRARFGEVVEVETVAEARVAARRGGPWAGFVVDHVLPDGEGLDLIGELRLDHPGVPAVLVTGSKNLDLARLCAASDVRYVPKPCELAHLEPFFVDVERARERAEKRRSGVHVRVASPLAVELEVLVLTPDTELRDCVIERAPAALRVVTVSDRASLNVELTASPIPCAVVVDMAIPDHRRDLLLAEVRRRWAHTPTLAVLCSPTRSAKVAASFATATLYTGEGRERCAEELEGFLRRALDLRLEWIASLLWFANDRGLQGTVLETFVAHVVLGVRRANLAEELGVEEGGVQKRVRRLCAALGVRRLAEVTQLLVTLPAQSIDPASIRALEASILAARVA